MKVSLRSDGSKTVILFDNQQVCKTGKTGLGLEQVVEYHYRKQTGKKAKFKEIMGEPSQSVIVENKPKMSDKFSINMRFGFVEKLIKMVASGVQCSAVITGEGGLGKTFTVTKTLNDAGYVDISDLTNFQAGTIIKKSYTTVKGYSTAKGLFRTLFENKNGVIVFDDCDSILKDPVALNLLKGALDSYSKRIISWNADMRDDDLPRSFCFEGRIIFISNMDQDKIDQAIRSRSMLIDLSMTVDQKIERMEHLVQSSDFMPDYSSQVKSDAISLIKQLRTSCKEISLRTLISVCKVRASNPNDYVELSEYMLTV